MKIILIILFLMSRLVSSQIGSSPENSNGNLSKIKSFFRQKYKYYTGDKKKLVIPGSLAILG